MTTTITIIDESGQFRIDTASKDLTILLGMLRRAQLTLEKDYDWYLESLKEDLVEEEAQDEYLLSKNKELYARLAGGVGGQQEEVKDEVR